MLLIHVVASLRLSGIIDGSGLSATFGKSEVKKIHEENLSQLSVMSEEEILSEQQKVYQMLGRLALCQYL